MKLTAFGFKVRAISEGHLGSNVFKPWASPLVHRLPPLWKTYTACGVLSSPFSLQPSTMKIAKNKTTLVRFGLIVNNVIGLTLTFYSIRRWSSPALGLVIIFCVSCVVNVFIGGFGLALNQRTTAFIKDANLSGSIVALLDAVLAIAFLALHIVSVSIADSSWQVRSTAMLMYGAFLGLVAW